MAEGSTEEKRSRQSIHRLVNNKNNLETLFLKRRLTSYQRELLGIIRRVDEERLDWVEFIRRVKHCESNNMPEYDWIHELLRESPPSPIDLLTLSSIKTHIPLPYLPSREPPTREPDQLSTTNSSPKVLSAPHTHPNSGEDSGEDVAILERAKTDALRQDLRSGHMVTRKDADVDRLLLTTPKHEDGSSVNEEDSRDVLTNLPTIRSNMGSSKHHRITGILTARSATTDDIQRKFEPLRKSMSDLELSRSGPNQAASGQPKTPVSREKSSFSTSRIPDHVIDESKDTYISLDGADDQTQVLNTSCGRDEKRKSRRESRDKQVIPLNERVADFYKRFDSWIVAGDEPKPKNILLDTELPVVGQKKENADPKMVDPSKQQKSTLAVLPPIHG